MNNRRLLYLLAILVACGSSFDPYSEINGPRLLAVRATPSALAPGASTVLDTLIVEAETSTLRWRWCPLIGGPTADFECLIDEATLSQAAGGANVDLDLGEGASVTFAHPFPGEVIDAICEQLEGVVLPNLTSTIDCTEGLPVQVIVEADLDGEAVTAIKEVVLLSSADAPLGRNENPVVGAVSLREGEALLPLDPSDPPSVAVGDERDLVVDVPETASQSFESEDGPARERLIMSWFTTAGELTSERETFIDGERDFDEARDVEWTAPPPGDATDGVVDFYVVVRDDRGGVNWTSGSIEVEAAQ